MSSDSKIARILRHRSAPVVGIILTFVAGLLTLVPAADEYSEIHARTEDVAFQLRQGLEDQASLAGTRLKAKSLQAELSRLEQLNVDQDRAQWAQQHLVQLTRETDCLLRRIDLSPARVRSWHENDHPYETIAGGARGTKTKFMLEVRELKLTITGGLPEIEAFLTKFETLPLQVHLQQMGLRTVDTDGEQLQLELMLQLFGIRRAEKHELART